jgi:hypothetical protein
MPAPKGERIKAYNAPKRGTFQNTLPQKGNISTQTTPCCFAGRFHFCALARAKAARQAEETALLFGNSTLRQAGEITYFPGKKSVFRENIA